MMNSVPKTICRIVACILLVCLVNLASGQADEKPSIAKDSVLQTVHDPDAELSSLNKYAEWGFLFHDDSKDSTYYWVSTRDGWRYGVYRLGDKEILPCVYQMIMCSGENCFVAKYGKWALMNKKFQFVTRFIFDDIFPPVHVKIANQYYRIDSAGKPVEKAPFDFASGRYPNRFKKVGLNGKFGYIDTRDNLNPQIVIPMEWDDVANGVDCTLFAVKKNKKWGYVNAKNEIVVPIKYHKFDAFDNGISLIRNASYSIIGADDSTGRIFFDHGSYDAVYYKGEGKFIVTKGLKTRCLDTVNHTVTKIHFFRLTWKGLRFTPQE